jgi:hypothetical protein
VDRETTSGSLTFQPGNPSLTFLVKICGDTSAEANETFIVTWSSLVNATVSSTGLGMLLDDDVLELLVEESGAKAPQNVNVLDVISQK